MTEPLVLVVDDEEGIRESLSDILRDEGYRVALASSGEEALKALKADPPGLVFLDVWLPGMDGLETLVEIGKQEPELPVIMITGHGTIETAVRATKAGAYDFLEKPLSLERVVLAAKRALERRRLEDDLRTLRETLTGRRVLVGESPPVKNLLREIELAGKSKSTVLIYGESGAGKELVAGLLHEKSPRAEMPFVEVNCAAIPQELIESELFGHEKGSFTGAFEKKKGKFELADGGTLFLDEVGDMSLQTQAKLLRAIETQEFQRVGGSKTLKVDIRVVAATNKDLKEEVKRGTFREDLLFRLNVIPITAPPLSLRRDDIPLLIEHFLKTVAGELGRPPKKITPEAVSALKGMPWPGNVRELKNTVERLVIMTPSDTIEAGDVKVVEPSGADYSAFGSLRDARAAFEKDFILKKLAENGWNVSKTAEAIDIERSNLHKKLKAYGIETP